MDETQQLMQSKADEDRTKRAFVGFLSSVLGVDQTLNTDDRPVSSSTGQYTIGNPDGTYSQLGLPYSNRNTGQVQTIAGIPVMWLLVAGVGYLLLRR